ncbi:MULTISPECIES: hypothetical protein [unclassified Nocardioides]|uniref:hypothetical protein n=1 Tax=unclassified Nocardioides TaxID=2615069 RepID=UPI0036174B38
MQWDLGLQGLAVLGVISLEFGVVAGLAVGGRSLAGRLIAAAITTIACFAAGAFTSEVLFGWATEKQLQPNIDGLSRDEILLSGVVTTVAVVLVTRHVAHRTRAPSGADGRRHVIGRHRGQPSGHA